MVFEPLLKIQYEFGCSGGTLLQLRLMALSLPTCSSLLWGLTVGLARIWGACLLSHPRRSFCTSISSARACKEKRRLRWPSIPQRDWFGDVVVTQQHNIIHYTASQLIKSLAEVVVWKEWSRKTMSDCISLKENASFRTRHVRVRLFLCKFADFEHFFLVIECREQLVSTVKQTKNKGKMQQRWCWP